MKKFKNIGWKMVQRINLFEQLSVNQYEIHWERKKENYIMGVIKFEWENISHYFMIFPDGKWGWKKPELTSSIKGK